MNVKVFVLLLITLLSGCMNSLESFRHDLTNDTSFVYVGLDPVRYMNKKMTAGNEGRPKWCLTGVVESKTAEIKLRNLIHEYGLDEEIDFDIQVSPEMIRVLRTNGVNRVLEFLREAKEE